jgi:hypothetical protein
MHDEFAEMKNARMLYFSRVLCAKSEEVLSLCCQGSRLQPKQGKGRK